MIQLTEEQRLTKPYKEHLREQLKTVDDFLGYLNACHEEGPETFALAVRDVLGFTATAMRDKCVYELGVMEADDEAAGTYPQGRGIYAWIAKRLESLTLDELEPEKQ